MNSLTQYIDLYRQNADAIDSHSARIMNEMRLAAASALEGKRLPEKGDEGFKVTSIEKMFEPDYGVNILRMNIPTELGRSFKCDIPNVSTLLGVVVNDSFMPTSTLRQNLPAGVDVMPLSKACETYPDIVSKYYNKIAPANEPSVAINTMLAQEGLFIKIGRGVHLESPIQIVNIFNSPTPLMGVRRVLVVAEQDSKAAIFFCDHTQSPDVKFLSSEIIEVAGEQSSELDIYSIEETTALTSRYSRLFANQGTGAKIRVGTATLHCGVSRNDFTINLNGERSAAYLSGLAIADGQMHVDNCSNVKHLAPHCDSDQLFKYLLDNNAQGSFEGGIYVDPNAPYTVGYQNNRNIVASPDARMHTEPQLLIYNDEVKCSHGTATGQLDANALFYMQARGIPRETARRMLMIAFMTDTLDTIKVEGIKSRLMMLVEKRLGGENVLCNDCHADCHPNIATPGE